MFCPNCGHELNDDARFCTECGRPLEAAKAILESAESDDEETRTVQSAECESTDDVAVQKKEPKALYIAGITVGLVVIAIVGYQLFFSKADGDVAHYGQKNAVVVVQESKITPTDAKGKKLEKYSVTLTGDNDYSVNAEIKGDEGFAMSQFPKVKSGEYTLAITDSKTEIEWTVPVKVVDDGKSSEAVKDVSLEIPKAEGSDKNEKDGSTESDNDMAHATFERVLNQYRAVTADVRNASAGEHGDLDEAWQEKEGAKYNLVPEYVMSFLMSSDIKYLYTDVDGDGIDELAVGWDYVQNPLLGALYKYQDGGIKVLAQSFETDEKYTDCALSVGGVIGEFTGYRSPSYRNIKAFYKFENGEKKELSAFDETVSGDQVTYERREKGKVTDSGTMGQDEFNSYWSEWIEEESEKYPIECEDQTGTAWTELKLK